MRNAMTNGYMSPMQPEHGLLTMRIDDLGGMTGADSPAGATQRTQAFPPIPTLADIPPLPSFSTMTPFAPYQSDIMGGQGYQPLNFMARSGYAPAPTPPASYGTPRYRPSGMGAYSSGYGGGFGGGTYSAYGSGLGGFNPYSQMA